MREAASLSKGGRWAEDVALEKMPPAPKSIDWRLLSEEDVAEMPVLAELRSLRGARRTVADR